MKNRTRRRTNPAMEITENGKQLLMQILKPHQHPIDAAKDPRYTDEERTLIAIAICQGHIPERWNDPKGTAQ